MMGGLQPRRLQGPRRCFTLPVPAVLRLAGAIDVVCSWDVEGFRLGLNAVERFDAGIILVEIESCGPAAGCPGCGVAAAGHGRVVEVVDAPWAGAPVRIRWCERRWMRLENTPARR